MSSVDKSTDEFASSSEAYTREQFEVDRARLVAVICAKHGIAESEVDGLIREHRYVHSEEDPEDDYIQIMGMARTAGWTR